MVERHAARTTDASLRGPRGSHLRVLGSFKATLTYGQRRHQETVHVIKNQNPSLLSRIACERLGLVKRIVQEEVEQDREMSDRAKQDKMVK